MKHRILILAAAAVSYAIDGNTGPDNSTTPKDTYGEVTIHRITVGRVHNSFQPNSIQAKPGDIVQFTFYPGNHSVIKAAYGYPCVPYENIVANGQGFDSGPMPADNTQILPTFNITVNNTDPTFFYCGAPASCFGWGMLGVINANNATDLVKQIAIARQESYETWPGQQIPAPALASLAAIAATATLVSSSASSIVSSASSTTTTAATTTSAAPAPASSSSSLSTGAIAGIAIGAAAVVLAAAVAFFLLGRMHRHKKQQTYSDVYLGPGIHPGHLPPYIPTEAKAPYDYAARHSAHNSIYSPPLQYVEHPSYMEYRSVNGSPPPLPSMRQPTTSELDGAAVPTAHSTPNLGTVQEIDSPHAQTRH